MGKSRHTLAQPRGKEQAELPCRFESSPPYDKWKCCRVSVYHMSPKPISFLHYHMEMEIGFCASGAGVLYLDKDVIPYKAGDAQIILPFQTHYNIATAEDTVWQFISFMPQGLHDKAIAPQEDFLNKLTEQCRLRGIFSPAEHPALVHSVADIAELALHTDADPYTESYLVVKLLSLLVLIGHTERDQGNNLARINRATNKIMPALLEFSARLENGSGMTIEEMAEICHFSPSYFRKVFMQIMGRQPKKYIQEEQLSRAAQLLTATDLTIAQISQQTGFGDVSVFFRSFAHRYGMPPGEYRRRNRPAVSANTMTTPEEERGYL